jgi:hypothetical protein
MARPPRSRHYVDDDRQDDRQDDTGDDCRPEIV